MRKKPGTGQLNEQMEGQMGEEAVSLSEICPGANRVAQAMTRWAEDSLKKSEAIGELVGQSEPRY